MLGSQLNSRWKHQFKPGQPVSCRVVAIVQGGYKVEFGQDKISGFLPTHQSVAIGTQLLLQFLGYKDQLPLFNASYGLQAYAALA